MMNCETPKVLKDWQSGRLKVKLFRTREEVGRAAAETVAQQMQKVMKNKEIVNMVFAAAPSQNEFLGSLTTRNDIDWSRVQAFHLDEYIGLPRDAPQRFANYLRRHIFNKVNARKVYYLDEEGLGAAEEKCKRYANFLEENPIDIACIGIGENGHIAFNDPPVADFEDPLKVRIVELDERCRRQQVRDGCFSSIDEVPTQAMTMTVPAIMSSKYIICVVPGPTKQQAIKCTLEGPVDTACPASILRRHEHAVLFLDEEAAALVRKG